LSGVGGERVKYGGALDFGFKSIRCN